MIVTRMSWRWVYGITSIVGVVTWIAIIFCLPETRKIRTPAELGKLFPSSATPHPTSQLT